MDEQAEARPTGVRVGPNAGRVRRPLQGQAAPPRLRVGGLRTDHQVPVGAQAQRRTALPVRCGMRPLALPATQPGQATRGSGKKPPKTAHRTRHLGIYRLRFCGRPEWYIGLTDNLERRFNQHVRKSSNRTIRRLVEEGHHLLYPEILVDGLKSLAHAEGAELALLATASRPEDCINDQHNPNGKTRTPPV